MQSVAKYSAGLVPMSKGITLTVRLQGPPDSAGGATAVAQVAHAAWHWRTLRGTGLRVTVGDLRDAPSYAGQGWDVDLLVQGTQAAPEDFAAYAEGRVRAAFLRWMKRTHAAGWALLSVTEAAPDGD